VRLGLPGLFDQADEVHVSVAFTWDIPKAERMAKAWEAVAPVKLGGPAYGDRGEEFEPGKYLAHGFIITSRGCPNKCWFCQASKREGQIVRELPIRDGWIVQDSNLLACSEDHVRAVFAMLARQPKRPNFSGGLDPSLLRAWHVDELVKLRPTTAWFAWDTPDDEEPLRAAAALMAGKKLMRRNYVLCGWPKDTFERAQWRMVESCKMGFIPQAMLFDRGEHLKSDALRKEWKRFAVEWTMPAVVCSKIKRMARGESIEWHPAVAIEDSSKSLPLFGER
jgi:hypothetical protein